MRNVEIIEITPEKFQNALNQIGAEGLYCLNMISSSISKQLSDLISHEDIISTIGKLMETERLPHLLFYGPPGTGKTSTILACAKQMYGKNLNSMVLQLNASDDRGT